MTPAATIEKSPTLTINETVNQLRSDGRTIFSFGLGQSPFPVPESVVRELAANAHQKDYLQVQGLKPLREAVADFHRREDTILVNPDLVLIGPGSKELIFQLMLSFEGDIILVTPCWVSYHPQARVLNKNVYFIHTTREQNWKLHPAALSEVCTVNPHNRKLLILNYPSNPCGNSYTLAELHAMASVAREHRVLVLSDEIYGQVTFNDQHVSMAAAYPEGTIVSTGLSKWCGAGGWRLGTFAFPVQEKSLLSTMISMASETFTSVSAPIQFAAIAAFSGGLEIDEYLTKSRAILNIISNWVVQKLSSEGVILHQPEGGFYVFPDFENFRPQLLKKDIRTSAEFCKTLLTETGVASLPGVVFGRPEHELTVRLSYVSFDGAKSLEAYDHIIHQQADEFMEQYCPEIFNGIRQLTGWLQNLQH